MNAIKEDELLFVPGGEIDPSVDFRQDLELSPQSARLEKAFQFHLSIGLLASLHSINHAGLKTLYRECFSSCCSKTALFHSEHSIRRDGRGSPHKQ